jgi:hypothetical protein
MHKCSEIPDQHIFGHAEEFCNASEFLFQKLAGPMVVRTNAALAIELFLKSLDSRWVQHDLMDETGIGGFEITAEPNTKGHLLDNLFDALPSPSQTLLNEAFQSDPLGAKHENLKSILTIYRNSFIEERYAFEKRNLASDSRSINEIVQLARFFRETIKRLPVKRY